jgi:dolichol-phosphate mannosyltransferase
MNDKSIIIVPTYNEADNIQLLIEKILSLNLNFDILVVDDNSPDGTSNIVKELCNSSSKLFLISRTSKSGLGSAYVTGFKWALEKKYSYIFEMDADMSHDPLDLINLKNELIEDECDMVIGSRYLNGVSVVNWPLTRIFLSYFANLYVRIITGMSIKDSTSGYVGYKYEALNSLDLDKIQFNGYAFQIEMKYKLWRKNYKLKEYQIIFVNRKFGNSKMDKSIIFEAITGVLKLKFNSKK